MLTQASIALIVISVILSVANFVDRIVRPLFPIKCYLHYVWMFFVILAIADTLSFKTGVWLLAFVSFIALREYFSLVNIRLQDRFGILGAYLSIPFMYYFILIPWYGMFIISVPVYSFLVIPLLVALGSKEPQGTVFSVGVIVLGMFLFVYCVGHIGYLTLFSAWKAGLLVLSVAICDTAAALLRGRAKSRPGEALLRYLVSLPFVIALSLVLSPWTGIPPGHSVILGCMVPLLTIMGGCTIDCIKADLGIGGEALLPGRGQIIDNTKSLIYAAPVFFHYIRYFLT